MKVKADYRIDRKTGQYIPTVDGVDMSPTSFSKERALEIATQLASMKSLGLLKPQRKQGA